MATSDDEAGTTNDDAAAAAAIEDEESTDEKAVSYGIFMDRNRQEALANMESLIMVQPTEPSDMGNTPSVPVDTHHDQHHHHGDHHGYHHGDHHGDQKEAMEGEQGDNACSTEKNATAASLC